MNGINRIVVVVLLIVAMVACCILLVGSRWVLPALARQLTALIGALEGLDQWYERELPGAVIASAIGFVLILLLIIELRRPKLKFIQAEKVTGGEVQVSVASIADRLRYEVNALPGVLRVRPKVSGKRKGVVVELDVDIAAGLDVPLQAEQIVEVARRVVEEKMGLKMTRSPKVNVRAVPYPTTPRAPEEKASAPELPATGVEPVVDKTAAPLDAWRLDEEDEET